jgi:hypothetical protein
MKYLGLRSRLQAIETQLGPRHQVIRVTGGVPPETVVSPANPPPKQPAPEPPPGPPKDPNSLS